MRLIHTARFEKDYSAAPTDVQRVFDKQERFLADNLWPSMRTGQPQGLPLQGAAAWRSAGAMSQGTVTHSNGSAGALECH